MIFVFGSNLAGRHGRGAAKDALLKYGAIYGCGIGLQGNSYAIPTKDRKMRPMSLERIGYFVREFIKHARDNPEKQYFVTRIGCGLAGYRDEQIAPMFADAPPNCQLPEGWR